MSNPFYLKDCTLAVLATGKSAASLLEFRDVLMDIPLTSIYYHFWGGRLSPRFIHREFHNDFARWAYFQLNDAILSERLGIIDPKEYKNLEDLRKVLLDIVEDRIEELDFFVWSRGENKFHFLHSSIVVFDTQMTLTHPSELAAIIPSLSEGSIYYHFIDARFRTPGGIDDFSFWLMGFKNEDYDELIKEIQLLDPYFHSLSGLRKKLTHLINKKFP